MSNTAQQSILHSPDSAIRDYRLFIDGKFVDASGGATFDDISPINGSVIARVAEANYDDVDRAVGAAKRAMHGEWGTDANEHSA